MGSGLCCACILLALGVQLSECVEPIGFGDGFLFCDLLLIHSSTLLLTIAFSMTQLHECLGSALGAMGPQSFLDLIPFNLDTEKLSEINIWLFPILKQYTVGAHLSYFTKKILGMIGEIKRKSQKV